MVKQLKLLNAFLHHHHYALYYKFSINFGVLYSNVMRCFVLYIFTVLNHVISFIELHLGCKFRLQMTLLVKWGRTEGVVRTFLYPVRRSFPVSVIRSQTTTAAASGATVEGTRNTATASLASTTGCWLRQTENELARPTSTIFRILPPLYKHETYFAYKLLNAFLWAVLT